MNIDYIDPYGADIASAAISAAIFDIPNSRDIADKYNEMPEDVLHDIEMARKANGNHTTA